MIEREPEASSHNPSASADIRVGQLRGRSGNQRCHFDYNLRASFTTIYIIRVAASHEARLSFRSVPWSGIRGVGPLALEWCWPAVPTSKAEA